MERAASDAEKRQRGRLPWLLLAGTVGVSAVGGWLASRSISSLLARVEQLEREAAESEARVAELQVLRDSMARRLHLLEQQQQGLSAQNAALLRRAGELQLLPAPPLMQAPPPPPAPAEEPLAKKGTGSKR